MSYLYKALTAEQIQTHLHVARHAVVGTITEDGRAQLNTVWFLYEDGMVWLSWFNWSNKYANLLRDGRICLCIPTAYGDGDRQVIIYGNVNRDGMIEQGQPGYNEELDYRMTQQYSKTEELARTTHDGDAKDGPWVQISFMPDRIIGDNYDC